MKISPIDIRQHTFEKGFRGYDVDEVNAFLNSLSQEWERVMNDNKLLKMQLEIAEKELNKLREQPYCRTSQQSRRKVHPRVAAEDR